MKVLVLGSGGREHALSWKIAQSNHCSELYIAPGNPGTSQLGTNVNIAVSDFEGIAGLVREKGIDLVVVGPEDPLVNGIRNFLSDNPVFADLLVVGPGKEGAMLEGSKDFSKQFMMRHNIPTASFATFTAETIENAYEFLESMEAPYVLKADGLAAGKGVIISPDLSNAKANLAEMLLEQKFGDASASVVIEEHLSGIELSVFVLTDGSDYLVLPEAKDYKRIGEGDTGLNTGGMGAVSPVPFANHEFMTKVEERVIKPTVNGLKSDAIDYRGFIFIGLMNVDGDPYVIEYNVRMGDPETQAVIPRVKSDLLEILKATANNTLRDCSIEIDPRTATTVVMVSGGYPGSYEKGNPIKGLDEQSDEMVFQAGTRSENGDLVSNGGRVLAVTALDEGISPALQRSYDRIATINWKDCYFRRDIGQDLLKIIA